jgi:hypothetical protein
VTYGGDSGNRVFVLYWRCPLIRVSVIRGSTVFRPDHIGCLGLNGSDISVKVSNPSRLIFVVSVGKRVLRGLG